MDDSRAKIAACCTTMIEAVGEDVTREGLRRTPERFAKALADLTAGYKSSVAEIVGDAIFTEDYSEMIVVRQIEFYSLCEHHLLPFFGVAHVGYIPRGKIIGLSKIPRIVNHFARRLQVQERFTSQIVEAIDEVLGTAGVGCMVEGKHMCMMMRGVQVQSSTMITHCMTGEFLNNSATRMEFMSAVQTRS